MYEFMLKLFSKVSFVLRSIVGICIKEWCNYGSSKKCDMTVCSEAV